MSLSTARKETRNDSRAHAQASAVIVGSAQLLAGLRAAVARIDHDNDFEQAEVEALRERLIALAHTTHAAGLSTYCSLCLHVLEQLRAMIEAHFLSLKAGSVLRTWINLSAKYFREPNLSTAAELVDNLGDGRWERPVGEAHRQALLGGLNDDWIRLELRQTLGSRVRALRNSVMSSRCKPAVG